jgi:hypothetical protein
VITTKETGMKQEERSSISVSKDTRARFMRYIRALAAQRDESFTQDEAENIALDAAETALASEWELSAARFDLTPSHLVAEKEAAKKRRVEELLKKGMGGDE